VDPVFHDPQELDRLNYRDTVDLEMLPETAEAKNQLHPEEASVPSTVLLHHE
jgi:hypothetical protein